MALLIAVSVRRTVIVLLRGFTGASAGLQRGFNTDGFEWT